MPARTLQTLSASCMLLLQFVSYRFHRSKLRTGPLLPYQTLTPSICSTLLFLYHYHHQYNCNMFYVFSNIYICTYLHHSRIMKEPMLTASMHLQYEHLVVGDASLQGNVRCPFLATCCDSSKQSNSRRVDANAALAKYHLTRLKLNERFPLDYTIPFYDSTEELNLLLLESILRIILSFFLSLLLLGEFKLFICFLRKLETFTTQFITSHMQKLQSIVYTYFIKVFISHVYQYMI